jgi:hypothetical protein
VLAQGRADPAGERVVVELARRDVHRHRGVAAEAGGAPGRELRTRTPNRGGARRE